MSETLGDVPFSGTAFVFRSKRTDRVKILVWDGSGLVLYWKRRKKCVSMAASHGRVMRLTSVNSPRWLMEWIGRVWMRAMLRGRPQRRESCDL